MKDRCACDINNTAGTEGGHVEHGPGKPVVDISYGTAGLNTYIFGQIETNNPVPNSFAYLGKNGISYRYEDNPPHWHIRLP